jgi:hypothetical protein
LLNLLIGVAMFLATLLGLGWIAWDYLINNPLPYRDPEAVHAVTTTAPRYDAGSTSPLRSTQNARSGAATSTQLATPDWASPRIVEGC